MDLRKGSDVPAGKRRCIRCRGQKRLYKFRAAWSFTNGGGTLQDCPLCLGKGHIDHVPSEIELGCSVEDLKEKESGKKRRRKSKDKEY
jgi:hypothetical protein